MYFTGQVVFSGLFSLWAFCPAAIFLKGNLSLSFLFHFRDLHKAVTLLFCFDGAYSLWHIVYIKKANVSLKLPCHLKKPFENCLNSAMRQMCVSVSAVERALVLGSAQCHHWPFSPGQKSEGSKQPNNFSKLNITAVRNVHCALCLYVGPGVSSHSS